MTCFPLVAYVEDGLKSAYGGFASGGGYAHPRLLPGMFEPVREHLDQAIS